MSQKNKNSKVSKQTSVDYIDYQRPEEVLEKIKIIIKDWKTIGSNKMGFCFIFFKVGFVYKLESNKKKDQSSAWFKKWERERERERD